FLCRRLGHGIQRRERLAVVEPGAGLWIVDGDRPEQLRRNILGQVQLVASGTVQEIAVGVPASIRVLAADVLEVGGHAGTGGVGVGEERRSHVGLVEGLVCKVSAAAWKW